MSEFVDQIFHVRAHKGSCFLRNLLAPPGEECLSIKHHWFGVCQGPQKIQDLESARWKSFRNTVLVELSIYQGFPQYFPACTM